MNGVEIAVAGLVFLLVGAGLCALGVFCYFMLRMMKGLQQSAEEVTRATRETLGEAKLIVSQAKDMLGDNSPLARAAKSVSSLSNNLPEVMAGLKIFSDTFSAVYRTTFNPEKVQSATRPAPVEDDSQFIPYDEGQAAQFEETVRARRERFTLSDEELAGMRTDKVIEKPPAPEPPTSTS